jgi:hypothetical protein
LAQPIRIVDFAPFSRALSAEDIGHGEDQLERVIRDRPSMEKYVSKGKPIWDWVTRQFAGEYVGVRIYWRDSINPSNGQAIQWNLGSCCIPPEHGQPGVITVAVTEKGKILDGEQLWSHLIFELYNIRNAAAFKELEKEAAQSRVTKEQFIDQVARLEYKTLINRNLFYEKYWVRNTMEMGIEPHPSNWGIPVAPTFEQWIHLFTDHAGYPWGPYGVLYDYLVVRNGKSGSWQQLNLKQRPLLTY